MLQSGCSYAILKSILEVLTIQHTADHAACEGVAAAYTVNDGMDAVLFGVIELLGISGVDASRPTVIGSGMAYTQRGYAEEAKWARHTRVFEAIHEGLDALGFHDVIRREWQSGLVVSVKYPDDPNWNFEKVHDYCYERGFTIYPGKISTTNTFRLCALGAIDRPDIEAFFKVFREALEVNKIQIPAKYKEA